MQQSGVTMDYFCDARSPQQDRLADAEDDEDDEEDARLKGVIDQINLSSRGNVWFAGQQPNNRKLSGN